MTSTIRNYRSNVPVKYLSASGGIASNTLQFNIDNADLLPPVPFTMVMEPGVSGKEEIITVTGVNGVQLTVVRGDEGNAPTSHLDGVELRHMVTGRDLQDSRDHVDSSLGIHGLNSSLSNNKVVGTKEIQTLEGKTLTAPLLNGGTITGATLTGTINASSATITSYATEAFVAASIGSSLPAGSITMWAKATAPTGWVLCEGQSASAYPALVAAGISTIPDMRGRVPIGYGDSPDAAAPTVYSTIGAKFGAETVALAITNMPSHNHPLDVGDGAGSVAKTSWMDRNASHAHSTAGGGSHQHNINTQIEIAGSLANDTQINWLINAKTTGGNYLITTAGEGAHDHGIYGTDTNHRHDIAAQGSGTAHENRQPSTVLNFIMKVA
jgi:microcystin-dependent protein